MRPFQNDPPSIRINADYLRQRLGSFFYRYCEQQGMLGIAHKLQTTEPFTFAELSFLEYEAPLPVLGALLEKQKLSGPLTGLATVTSIFFLPLESYLNAHGRKHGSEYARTRLIEFDERVHSDTPIAIVVDTWKGRYSFMESLSCLARLVSETSLRNDYYIYGPSTAELSWLITHDTTLSLSDNALDDALELFQSHGITTISGGWDTAISEHAAKRGFRVVLGQKLAQNAFSKVAQETEFAMPRPTFLGDLLRLRHQFESEPYACSWTPLPEQLSEKRFEDFRTTVCTQVLRAVALGRLLLPESIAVKAPISLLGAQYARLAYTFGARDIGGVALDSETSRALNIPLSSSVQQTSHAYITDFSESTPAIIHPQHQESIGEHAEQVS